MAGGRQASRRRFLGAAVAGGAAGAAPLFVPVTFASSAFANESANDRPGVACIGTGGIGMRDAREHRE